MRINEVDDKFDKFKDVDLVDDLQFFMNNDPWFYRKVLYPAILTMKQSLKNGGDCKQNHFEPCINKGVDAYCSKFKLQKNSKNIFSDEEIQEDRKSVV
jgi:hypothetical protein